MPLPIVAQTSQLVISGLTANGSTWANVWHFRFLLSGYGTNVDRDALISLVHTLYFGTPYPQGVQILGLCPSTLTARKTTFTKLDGQTITHETTYLAAGSSGAISAPTQTSMVVTKRSDLRGRRNRGRVYLPPFAPGSFDTNGNLVAGEGSSLINNFTGWLAALNTASWVPAVLSRKASTAVAVTAFTMDLIPDVQRRRKA